MAYTDIIDNVAKSAHTKVSILKSGALRYFLASFLSGIYISLGTIFVIVIGSITFPLGGYYYSIFMGLFFAAGLSIVIMAGAELFTGINFVGGVGIFTKAITIKDLCKILAVSYIGNLVGSVFVSFLFYYINSDALIISVFIDEFATPKLEYSSLSILIRAFFCNILVCLAVLCSIKLKSESAKLIMIFWCLFIFIASRYEHSIANMSIFSIAYLYDSNIEIKSILHNLTFATIGNMLGGFFLAFSYFHIGKHEQSEKQ